MSEGKEVKKKIEAGQILIGALWKFGKLDIVDFRLILDDFIDQSDVKVHEYLYIYDAYKYIKYDNFGTFSISDHFIEEENCTVKEKLFQMAGEEVIEYFDNMDVEEFKKKKEQIVKERKNDIINNANILLISDVEEQYEELKKYGFNNVDYFKSIIRADKYFKTNSEELNKYHIVIKGRQNVQNCCFHGEVALNKKIWSLRGRDKSCIVVQLYDYSKDVHFSDKKTGMLWKATTETYSELISKIIESAIVNNVMEMVDLKGNKYQPIEDYINPNRLPLPTKKQDLKILYLDTIRVNQYAQKIAEELGLNVTFLEDNNSTLGKHVKEHLGDYDIIIASDLYSGQILKMNEEIAEQGKDTGRDLGLLVTYGDSSLMVFSKNHDVIYIGSIITLKHILGGSLANDKEPKVFEFKIPNTLFKGSKGEKISEFDKKEGSKIKSILEQSVTLYNNALLELGKPGINDIDFKTTEQYNEEVLKIGESVEKRLAKLEEEQRKKDEESIKLINVYDQILESLGEYLKCKKEGLITEKLKGFKIFRNKEGLHLVNIRKGVPVCEMTFPYAGRDFKSDFRRFTIQMANGEGILGEPTNVGVYVEKYLKEEGIPRRCNEKEIKAILDIKSKLDYMLQPIMIEALKRNMGNVSNNNKRRK